MGTCAAACGGCWAGLAGGAAERGKAGGEKRWVWHGGLPMCCDEVTEGGLPSYVGLVRQDEVPLGGATLRVETWPDYRIGSSAWPSGVLLAHALVAGAPGLPEVRGRRVAELGAGPGLPGLACGLLGAASVTLTDRVELVPLLERNIELNGLGHNSCAESLDWSWASNSALAASSRAGGPLDVVLAADVVYFEEQEPREEAHLILDGAQPSARRLAALLGRTPLRTGVSDAFEAVQRGKLLLNMTNAVNALSGQAIGPMFFDPAYRRVLAASMSEATAVFEADGLAPQAAARRDAFLLRWLTTLLLSPQWFFAATMGRRLKGRGDGFTSMAQDMQARRVPTEIDFLNGAILQLGEALGVPTPVNAKLVALVKAAEQANEGCPGISGADLLQHTGLATISPSPLWRLVRMAMAGLIAARALKAAHSLRSSL